MNTGLFGCRFVPWIGSGLTLLSLLLSHGSSAQSLTQVSGTIKDARTGAALPFVSILLVGTSVGTTTDQEGQYTLRTPLSSTHVQVSFLGYVTQRATVRAGSTQVVDFRLVEESFQLKEVVVSAEKKRYRNKDNPAAELIRKVIAHKDQNRKEGLAFYEYDKYEKVEFDLNNITEKFKNRRPLRNLQFIFDHVDTSLLTGKAALPIFLRENRSKVYYRKEPQTQREYALGQKMVSFGNLMDNAGVSAMVDNLYQEVNIYQDRISLMTNPFMSPIAALAPTFYKFYLVDTTLVGDRKCIRLDFEPRNKADQAFVGSLYILADSSYAVKKVTMGLTPQVNLNYVNHLNIEQEYALVDGKGWMLAKDRMQMDFSLRRRGTGLIGKRSVHYQNYLLNQPRADSVYGGLQQVVKATDADAKSEAFWQAARPEALSRSEQGIYNMVDSVKQAPSFQRMVKIATLLLAGFTEVGLVEIGPVNTFYSWNYLEGFRLRFGGRTTLKWSKKLLAEGYLAYGFRDQKTKYSAGLTYSFNDDAISNPLHAVRLTRQREVRIPGQELQFVAEDNALLSIKRGVSDKFLYNDLYKVEYIRETGKGFSYDVTLKNLTQTPAGELYFYAAADRETGTGDGRQTITTSEAAAHFRYAPNEQYYQGKRYRVPIFNKYPIFQVTYGVGLKNVFGGDYNYHQLQVNLFKRFYSTPLGYTDAELEGTKYWGTLPFPLLNIHRANQTYSYQLSAYNLMNFLEFVSDQSVSLNVAHYFNGFFFNKIPGLRRLKWREVVTFKALYGRLSDGNQPDSNPTLLQFPTDNTGQRLTYRLGNQPYIEASVGIGNIFKLFRVDLVRRLTYLDHPNVSRVGIRARFKFDF